MTGWATVGSNKYYFGADGKMATNKYIQTGGQTYYVDASGRMKKNCWYNGQYFNNKGQLEKNATKYDSETTEGQVTKECWMNFLCPTVRNLWWLHIRTMRLCWGWRTSDRRRLVCCSLTNRL